jgi:hypothetical protein
LGGIFDLINFVPIVGFPGAIQQNPCNNQLRDINVAVFALEIPTSCLLGNSDVIGVWSATRKLTHSADGNHIPGDQVSRLGNPLVNELVIGLRDKAKFTQAYPSEDRFPPNNFQTYVLFPSMPYLINALFNGAINQVLGFNPPVADFAPKVPPVTGRQDLFMTYLTGIPGLNKPPNVVPAEMMRLNTTIPATPYGQQNTLGVIGGDAAGFPNGRRPGDDVVDISLDVLMGRLCILKIGCQPSDAPVGNASLTDGAPIKDTDFLNKFPYFNGPIPGYPQFNDQACYPSNSQPQPVPVPVPVPVPNPIPVPVPVPVPVSGGCPVCQNCPSCPVQQPITICNRNSNSNSGASVVASFALLASLLMFCLMF